MRSGRGHISTQYFAGLPSAFLQQDILRLWQIDDGPAQYTKGSKYRLVEKGVKCKDDTEIYGLFSFQFQDFRFLCPNDTVFDQQNLVCTNWFEVDCFQSVKLFTNDFGFKDTKEEVEPQDYSYEEGFRTYEYYEYEDSDNG